MKTKEQLFKEVETYLEKTAQHLFVIHTTSEKPRYYKILPFKKEGTLYCVTLEFGEGYQNITTRRIGSDNALFYGLNYLKKSMLFPGWFKAKSIPSFKKFRIFLSEFRDKVKLEPYSSNINKHLEEELSKFYSENCIILENK